MLQFAFFNKCNCSHFWKYFIKKENNNEEDIRFKRNESVSSYGNSTQSNPGKMPILSEGSAISLTPSSSSSLQEMRSEFQPESPVHVHSPAHRNRRRASMQDTLDKKMFDATLYDKVSGCHQSFGSLQEEFHGCVNISLEIDDNKRLNVGIICAQDLQSNYTENDCLNPYCEVKLTPCKQKPFKTHIKSNTNNPEYEETFSFPIQNISESYVTILVFNSADEIDECLGQLEIHIADMDLSYKQLLWRGLNQLEDADRDHAEIQFSLSYLKSAERLTAVIQEARKIEETDDSKQFSGCTVKMALIQNGKRVKKKKTSRSTDVSAPVWNESLVFNLARDILTSTSIEITVFQESLLGHTSLIGSVTISQASSKSEKSHWNDLQDFSKPTSARWHKLIPP